MCIYILFESTLFDTKVYQSVGLIPSLLYIMFIKSQDYQISTDVSSKNIKVKG